MTTDLEDRAAEALARRAAQAVPRPDFARVERAAHVRRAVAGEPMVLGPGRPRRANQASAEPPVRTTERPTRYWRRRWVPVAAAATIVVGGVAIAQLVGGSGGQREPGWGGPSGVPDTSAPPLSWQTPHASLAADQISIEYAGRTLSPPSTAFAESEVLGRTRERLTLRWSEQDMNVRWELSFTMRDGEWWIDRMVVGDTGGLAPEASVMAPTTTVSGVAPEPPPMPPMNPEVAIERDGARMPLGQLLGGDVDVADGDSAPSARVSVVGLRVLGFRARVVLPDEGETAVSPTNELLPAPQLPADVRPTGLYGPESEWMTVLVARDELTRECMAAAGIEYPRIPDDAIERRVDRRAAAAEFGYHPGADDEPILNGGAHGIPDKLSADEQEAYYAAMGLASGDGCLQQAQASMGGEQDLSPMRGWDAVIQLSGQPIEAVHMQAYDAPEVAAAVMSWRECVFAAVGESAANPDELERIYAFEDGRRTEGTASDHEKDVAVADYDCRQQVGWEIVWDTAVVERERAAMGDRVGEYDQWVRDYQAMLAAAQQVLDERGIVLPSAD